MLWLEYNYCTFDKYKITVWYMWDKNFDFPSSFATCLNAEQAVKWKLSAVMDSEDNLEIV